MTRLVICLVAFVAIACERDGRSQAQEAAEARAELDAGALRASAIEGLEAAARDPVIASKLALAATLERPDLEVAVERMLARVSADPKLGAVADQLFADVQDSPAMRATLAELARANPELDLSALTEAFVAQVDERLTRPELAEVIEASLRARVRGSDAVLAEALIVETGAAELLATAIIVSFADAKVRAALERQLGKDVADLQERLGKRLAEPRRVGHLVEALGERLRSEAAIADWVAIVDHETTAELLAAALARMLADAAVRDRCEALFGLALAQELDLRAFERELRALLNEDAVSREVEALLFALAREEFVRERVAGMVAELVGTEGFATGMAEALTG